MQLYFYTLYLKYNIFYEDSYVFNTKHVISIHLDAVLLETHLVYVSLNFVVFYFGNVDIRVKPKKKFKGYCIDFLCVSKYKL